MDPKNKVDENKVEMSPLATDSAAITNLVKVNSILPIPGEGNQYKTEEDQIEEIGEEEFKLGEEVTIDEREIDENNDLLNLKGFDLTETYNDLLISLRAAYMHLRIAERDKASPNQDQIDVLTKKILSLSNLLKRPEIGTYHFLETQIQLLSKELKSLKSNGSY
ncbi:hypothetical protein QNI19_31865 [Cytophagaceae bacterium DM2B3-1]|uniref:Uncharacterized protein n=1 Tax=Xanthocytophaga flava TaxID=3048013 RepID=A0ABT7CUY7_9BACT|nr:hypothetical protein [Xanthocytophaga flavus]MDJ1497579.1 hypothetical protein [Xanthocytophaga flavus]